jgi:hypothetical protein
MSGIKPNTKEPNSKIVILAPNAPTKKEGVQQSRHEVFADSLKPVDACFPFQ